MKSVSKVILNQYYYRAFVSVWLNGISYGNSLSFTKEEMPIDFNGHEYVDLGLPSGLLWATCNVGATAPEQYGDYFAWGETTGYDEGKTDFSWSTYKYCKVNYHFLTKYCTDSGFSFNDAADDKTVLDLVDDAARANWGGDWRMPTHEEWSELYGNCSSEWTTLNGVNGHLFTSKNNGNTLFLPAAGPRYGVRFDGAGYGGHYWSASLRLDITDFAWYLRFFSNDVDPDCYISRCVGYSVRAVCP